MKTVAESLAAAVAALQHAGVDEARVKSEWLLSGILRTPRWTLAAEPGRALAPEERGRVEQGIARLAAGEPLQYVQGETDFHGRTFRCDPRALIPRPETEELVESCLRHRNLWSRPQPEVVDVGTGTGCIAITLALERPKAHVTGIDCSPAALELARENAERLGAPANLELRAGDLLDGFAPESLDAVISNPPYLSDAELDEASREVREHEPRLALAAGPTGLEILERLAVQAFGALRRGGMVWLEIGSTQEPGVRALLDRAGFRSIQVARDLAGLPRVASGRKT